MISVKEAEEIHHITCCAIEVSKEFRDLGP